MLNSRIKHWRNQRLLRRYRIPLWTWSRVVQQTSVLRRLNTLERRRLRRLASMFLRQKVIVGERGLHVNDDIRVAIAAQACLLILNLDLSCYRGWREIIVYPESFIVQREVIDANGLVSDSRRVLSGESWQKGPVIIAWTDTPEYDPHHRIGSNVILHEFAHKLDMQNGVANGMPPLHANMVREHWTYAMSRAYDQLCIAVRYNEYTGIDSYASENPAEFFAVLTEVFFESPVQVQQFDPLVYEQLRQYYKQNPMSRYSTLGSSRNPRP
jgi:Mlc titration factor MtfA (ptsG expression regulator)